MDVGRKETEPERGSRDPQTPCLTLTLKMDYDQRTNRYMAVGRQIFQDACTGQTCLRTRKDRVEWPTGQASTRGPWWRPAASDNGGRRLSGGGSAVECSAGSGLGGPRT